MFNAKDDVPCCGCEVEVEVPTIADIPTAEADNCVCEEMPERYFYIDMFDIMELLKDEDVRKKLVAIKIAQEKKDYIDSLREVIRKVDKCVSLEEEVDVFASQVAFFLYELLEIKENEKETE